MQRSLKMSELPFHSKDTLTTSAGGSLLRLALDWSHRVRLSTRSGARGYERKSTFRFQNVCMITNIF